MALVIMTGCSVAIPAILGCLAVLFHRAGFYLLTFLLSFACFVVMATGVVLLSMVVAFTCRLNQFSFKYCNGPCALANLCDRSALDGSSCVAPSVEICDNKSTIFIVLLVLMFATLVLNSILGLNLLLLRDNIHKEEQATLQASLSNYSTSAYARLTEKGSMLPRRG